MRMRSNVGEWLKLAINSSSLLMATSLELPEQRSALQQRLQCAEGLVQKAEQIRKHGKIQGMQKMVKQIKSEMAMLQKLICGSVQVKTHHLVSTNLLHLEALLHICEHAPGVVSVERRVVFRGRQGSVDLLVDVVTHQGSCWVKVFARKRRALHKKWLGEGNYEDKTVTDFAEDYIAASQQNPHRFVAPTVAFAFFDGITRTIAEELGGMGVMVVGPVYADDSDESSPSPLQVAAMFCSAPPLSSPPSLPPSFTLPEVTTPGSEPINLDISSMLAWVSALTNGSAGHHFKDPVLEEQARDELSNPLCPKLESVTKGRSLIACSSAVQDFKSIVAVMGGPGEKQRAKELLDRIKIVDDAPSTRAQQLRCSGKIKPRAKVIFGTGDSLKAVTLTANKGFARAAAGQGVDFTVVVHACRALSEMAEQVQCPQDLGRRNTVSTSCGEQKTSSPMSVPGDSKSNSPDL